MSEPAAEIPDLSGRTLGDYQILRKLGSGGMGQVYLARQQSLKREIALKFLNSDLVNNEKALKRFQAEAEAVARISHPNIVQVYAIGEHDGLRYMALEFVNGRNLRDYLSKKGPPDLPVALAILKQVASALQKANELGIVHRDIKPENILMTRKVEVKVTDFGLSRLTDATAVPLNLTQSGVTLGTPLYMAPEQVQGKPTDHRSDLYSFGVTAYHLLAGQPPFHGKTAYEVAMKHCTETPEPLAALRPDLPGDLIALVHKLMAKDSGERYQTAKDVLRDLAKIAKGNSTGVAAPPLSLSATMMQSPFGPVPSGSTMTLPLAEPARSPWPARILGVLAVLGLFAGGWWLFGKLQPTDEIAVVNAGPGLPEVKFPEGLAPQTGRERDLLAKLDNRQTSATDFLNASVELGLLYVKERRLEQAKKVFDDLEKERPDRGPIAKGFIGPPPALLAARFGQAIVLAHQDKAEESVTAFVAITNQAPRPPASEQMRKFLIDRPDFSQAIAEAIYRDQENLKGKKPLPPQLDWLRNPGSLIRGREKS